MTKSITLPVSYLGTAKDAYGNDKIAFAADHAERKDYGLTWNAPSAKVQPFE